jgi:hypothetical protein
VNTGHTGDQDVSPPTVHELVSETHRERCRSAKIPEDRVFTTKGELARAMIYRCFAAGFPVTADQA